MPPYACILTCTACSFQVELAQSEYQLPRLTRMWTHLERQAGGKTKGMGEKQIEVDKRLLRGRMARLRTDIEEVARGRGGGPGVGREGPGDAVDGLPDPSSRIARSTLPSSVCPRPRRPSAPGKRGVTLTATVSSRLCPCHPARAPVVSPGAYAPPGVSGASRGGPHPCHCAGGLHQCRKVHAAQHPDPRWVRAMGRWHPSHRRRGWARGLLEGPARPMSSAPTPGRPATSPAPLPLRVLAEDKLFATLDPTTRRVELGQGQEVLLTDTVGER